MRLIHEGTLVIAPIVLVGLVFLQAPRSGDSTILWPIAMVAAIALMVVSFRALRRPILRNPARGLALLLLGLSIYWSLLWGGLAAGWIFWALLEITLGDVCEARDSGPLN